MYTLRPYQQESVDATLDHFRKSKEPAVIMLPTGAGKSLVIAELAKIARGRVLVLAHVKELVEQNHEKYESYGLKAGIFSAALERKDSNQKVIFGSIQSVARAGANFFHDFSLLVIDECHRVSMEEDSQYVKTINKLKKLNPGLCILGLTATPYRLEAGWIYEYSTLGILRTEEERFFKKCIYELSLRYMIKNKFLTPAIKIERPVAAYDFSELQLVGVNYKHSEIEEILVDQARITPVIVENIIALSKERQGVMIFASSIRHAREILSCLPTDQAEIVIGDTENQDREQIISDFKAKRIKFLVNVSVLTTGFDAPHVDLIAIMRPTESVALYQQIIGRGLRLSPGKKDCLILDYANNELDLFTPRITDRKTNRDSVPVKVNCPECKQENDFWGLVDEDGNIIEHYGQKCRSAKEDANSGKVTACGFRFRSRACPECDNENDYTAKECNRCGCELRNQRETLALARKDKKAHVLRPDMMQLEKSYDKKGSERLEIRYYDHDANYLTEYFYLENSYNRKKFYYNFLRMHLRRPELEFKYDDIDQVVSQASYLRTPMYLIARKQKYYWQVQEKIFL